MATLNLGRIKPVFKGAWTSGAFVIDDIVTHGNECFICIQAGTNKATSDASYWTKLAAKGTDGTDVGTTITTQGDILFRDGSGLQRLAKGTASQQLAMNSGATAPEWVDASGGGVLQIKRGTRTTTGTFDSSSAYASFGVSVAITPTANNSSFWINAVGYASPSNHDTPFKFNISDSQVGATTAIFTDASRSHTHMGGTSHFGAGSFGADSYPDNYWIPQMTVGGMYTPASNNANARTFTLICRHSTNGTLHINQTQINDNSVASGAVSTIEVWEIANGIYS